MAEYVFIEEQDSCILKGAHNLNGVLDCPDTYNGKPVVAIRDDAFHNNNDILEIIIPDSITKIGDRAFQACEKLSSIKFGKNLKSIGESAFSFCRGLKSVTLPESLTYIGSDAFYFCTSLTSLKIPESVSDFDNNTFYLVANIEYTGSAPGAPWGAKALNGYVEDGLVYQDSTKYKLLAGTSNSSHEVIVPDGVKIIGQYAFYGCAYVTSVSLPHDIEKIENLAFSRTGIAKKRD